MVGSCYSTDNMEEVYSIDGVGITYTRIRFHANYALQRDEEDLLMFETLLHPQPKHFFFFSRFGHTTVPPGYYKRDRQCKFKGSKSGDIATRLCKTWWNSQVSRHFNLNRVCKRQKAFSYFFMFSF